MEGYQKLAELGRGTFGSVSQYIQKADGSVVAIKRIKPAASKQGLDVPTLREIKLLTELKHPNIVRLHSAFMHKKAVHLVLEYMESDLEAVIRDRSIVLSEADVKSYMRMILSALAHCHTSFVVHRDVKPNNMLLAADGTLKLADFGLARTFGSPDRNYTHNVFARWYRPPELFFGALKYGLAIDVWAAGARLARGLRPSLSCREMHIGALPVACKIICALTWRLLTTRKLVSCPQGACWPSCFCASPGFPAATTWKCCARCLRCWGLPTTTTGRAAGRAAHWL